MREVTTRAILRAVRGVAKATRRELRESKTAAKGLRMEANYVDSTPRCGNCVNHAFPVGIGTSYTGHVCRLLASQVTQVGLCDHWTGADGSTLDVDDAA